VVTPGQTFDVTVAFHATGNRGVQPGRLELVAPAGWKVVEKSPGLFNVTVPDRAAPTAAFWRRDSVRESTYSLDDRTRLGQPLPATPLLARAHYSFNGSAGVAEREPQLAVGPALAVRFATDAGVLPVSRDRYRLRPGCAERLE
jgi:hypothetical protein